MLTGAVAYDGQDMGNRVVAASSSVLKFHLFFFFFPLKLTKNKQTDAAEFPEG